MKEIEPEMLPIWPWQCKVWPWG